MAAAVDEDVASCAVAACSAEPLWRVALLQGALVLLHLQPVIGDLQLLVSHLGVQLEWLTCGEETQGLGFVLLASWCRNEASSHPAFSALHI